MYILRYGDGWVAATFKDEEKGEKFYNSLPEDLRKKVTPSNVLNLTYPYYQLWTFELVPDGQQRDESKDSMIVCGAETVDRYVKEIKRNKEWEATFEDEFDAQYFYLGIVTRDGIVYSLQKDLGIYPAKGLSQLCDHEHVFAYLLNKIKAEGVRRATMYWKDEEFCKRFKYRARQFRRLMNISRSTPLSERATKGKKRLTKWLDRNLNKWKEITRDIPKV